MGNRRASWILIAAVLLAQSVMAQAPIEIRTQMAPPGWSLMERQLMVERVSG